VPIKERPRSWEGFAPPLMNISIAPIRFMETVISPLSAPAFEKEEKGNSKIVGALILCVKLITP
jgi:hypothetical protein